MCVMSPRRRHATGHGVVEVYGCNEGKEVVSGMNTGLRRMMRGRLHVPFIATENSVQSGDTPFLERGVLQCTAIMLMYIKLYCNHKGVLADIIFLLL